MSELADLLHKLVDAIFRPADHPAAELHDEVDALGGSAQAEAPAPSETGSPAPEPAADVTGPYDAPPDDTATQPAEPAPPADG